MCANHHNKKQGGRSFIRVQDRTNSSDTCDQPEQLTAAEESLGQASETTPQQFICFDFWLYHFELSLFWVIDKLPLNDFYQRTFFFRHSCLQRTFSNRLS